MHNMWLLSAAEEIRWCAVIANAYLYHLAIIWVKKNEDELIGPNRNSLIAERLKNNISLRDGVRADRPSTIDFDVRSVRFPELR
jgi:hypothetical protein